MAESAPIVAPSAAGSASASAPGNVIADVTCPACWTDYRATQMVYFYPCSHALCRVCTLAQIRATLLPDAQGVPCPTCVDGVPSSSDIHVQGPALTAVRCSSAGEATAAPSEVPSAPPRLARASSSTMRTAVGMLTEDFMRRLHVWSIKPRTVLPAHVRPLGVEDVNRFARVYLASALARNASGDVLLRCPSSDCGLIFLTCRGQPRMDSCPYCDLPLCASCAAPWPASTSAASAADAEHDCATAHAAAREEVLTSLLHEKQGRTFVICPSCGEAVTHWFQHGCHHMTCVCGVTFCYLCSVMDPDSSSEHGCNQCCFDDCGCPICPTCAPGGNCEDCWACPACSPDEWSGVLDVRRSMVVEEEPDGGVIPTSVADTVRQPPAAALGHTGAWRTQTGAYYCSVRELRDGPLCIHGSDGTEQHMRVITRPHWSCCGGRRRRDVCTRTMAYAAPAE